MPSGLDTLFGPLSKQYCFYFYFLSLFFLISLVFFVATGLYVGISKKKGLTYYLPMILVSTLYGMLYLQNRLLFVMCSHSL